MPNVNHTCSNFVGGELCPSVNARCDIKVYANGCSRLENFILEATGPVKFRTGTRFVNPTKNNSLGRLIPFQFSDEQAYLIECTPGYFRFYKDEGIICRDDKTITAISSDGVITAKEHGLSNGNEIFIGGLKGSVEILNGRSYTVSDVATDTFKIKDEDGNYIDFTGLEYISGGVLNAIVEIENPYKDIENMSDDEIMEYLHKIDYAQNADTSYFVHPKYAPKKLTRTSHQDWTFKDFTRTSDPFTKEGDYPRSVCFDGAGRLIYGGTENDPEMLMMSRGPDAKSGEPRYDDFTTGDLANDALKVFINPSQGKVESIQWLTANDRYFLVGTFSGVRRVVSADGYDSAFSAESGVLIKPIDSCGCERIRPVPRGNSLFYIQRGGLVLRCLSYDLYYDSYKAADKNLVSDLILDGGTREHVFQQSRPDILWHVRKDGKLIGLTYHESEDISGWHRQIIGGTNAKVISAGIMPRKDNYEQVWMIVERFINGKIRRYVEFITDFEKYKTIEDFYTNAENEESDKARYENDLYQRQKLENHLDCCLTYDGSKLGLNENATLSIGDIDERKVSLITSDVDIFESSDVDREIWRIHDSEGNGSGRMRIVEYISSKEIKCLLLSAFDKNELGPGEWSLTTSKISGLEHLEGEHVSVVTDGALHNDRQIQDGKISLDSQADVVHIGYSYRGLLKTMNIQAGGTTGSAQNKPRHVQKVAFEFLNTLGVKYGTSLYDLVKMPFRKAEHKTNRPSPLFSGSRKEDVRDNTESKKFCYVVQDVPLPCTLQALDIFMETIDD